MKFLCAISLILFLTHCSSHTTAPKKIGEAVTAPLADLNLVRTNIPSVLVESLKNPYALPTDISCTSLSNTITQLNAVLGADLDTPIYTKKESLIERSVSAIEKNSLSTIRKTTESIVPFRNWVRELSGAEKKSKAVAAAITAGSIRRAYLKGLGQANHCEPPAAPQAPAAIH